MCLAALSASRAPPSSCSHHADRIDARQRWRHVGRVHAVPKPLNGALRTPVLAIVLVLLAACGAARGADEHARWNDLLALLTEQATNPVLAYHNPDHDEARRETLRQRVRAARTEFETQIEALRATIEQARGGEISQRQLLVLQRYEAIAAIMEQARLAQIDGALPELSAARISNDCVFSEINWTLAEQMETDAGLAASPHPLHRLLVLDQRADAYQMLARRAVRLGDTPLLEDARRNLLRLAVEMRDLAPRFAAPPPLPDMPESDRAAVARYLAETPAKLAAHVAAIEALVQAFGQATPEDLDTLQWDAFVIRHPAPTR